MTAQVEQRIPYPRRIFCNRNLRMDGLRFVGFDMDYTLALYTEHMEHLQAELALQRLVQQYGYPRAILASTYDPTFAIRGLVVDLEHGNVLKMDAHRFVGRVWHGGAPLDRTLRRETYTNRKIAPADPAFAMVDTLFSLPEISLYCQLVALFDGLGPDESKPSYERVWRDLRGAMDSLHRDGTLKAIILKDIPRYVIKDDELAESLHRFRSAGKKLFILTNSEPNYTEAVMTHLLDGAHSGYAHWRDYFEWTLCSAKKPLFFQSEDPFLEVGLDGTPGADPAETLRRGAFYVGGNVRELGRLTGMLGEEVLYVGDHIYGDILRSKRNTSWRTAMVIQEMERELAQLQDHSGPLARLDELEAERFQLNLERTARRLDGNRDGELGDRARQLDREILGREESIADAFNPRWGMLFRDRGELSAFGAQVEDYACVYTSRASNFRFYSPAWYFRSPRDRMAHELTH
jgi:HAD superfamily 5'-nucleotidase-like hydrolase